MLKRLYIPIGLLLLSSPICQAADTYDRDASLSPARSSAAQRDSSFTIADYASDTNRDEARGTSPARSLAVRDSSNSTNEEYSVENDNSVANEGRRVSRTERSARSERVSDEFEATGTSKADSDFSESNVEKRSDTDKSGDTDRKLMAKWRTDARFARHAAMGNATEVAMGRLGVERATNPKVKEFSQTLVNDHGKANDKLLAIEDVKKWEIQAHDDKAREKAADKLKDKEGLDFDRAFIDHMVADHEKNAAAYEKAIENCKNAEVKSYARETLPTIKDHLRVAKEIQTELGEKPAKDTENAAEKDKNTHL